MADDIFKCVFINENFCIFFRISLKFVPSGTIYNKAALVQVMAWCRTGDKPLLWTNVDQFIDAYMRHSGEMSWTPWLMIKQIMWQFLISMCEYMAFAWDLEYLHTEYYWTSADKNCQVLLKRMLIACVSIHLFWQVSTDHHISYKCKSICGKTKDIPYFRAQKCQQ